MRKNLLVLIFLLISVISFSQNTINVDVVAGPTFNRPLGGAPPTGLSAVGTSVYYTVVNLDITTPVSVDITATMSVDNFGILYNTAGFNPASPLTNALVANDDGAGSGNFKITYNFTTPGTYFVVVTTFSNNTAATGTVATTGGTLPIKLQSFTAAKAGAKNIINWKTSQELNVESFVIQRSNNGVNFTEDIATVSAQNSATGAAYSANDASPKKNINYYRMKIVDKDGHTTFSPTASVNNKSKATEVSVFPNPASQFIVVQLAEEAKEKVSITIINNEGKVVSSKQFDKVLNNQIHFEVAAFAKGNYYVKVSIGNHESTVPFVKL